MPDMRTPDGWDHSAPPLAAPLTHSMEMLMGQMLERLNQIARDMHEVRDQLRRGNDRFAAQDRHAARQDRRLDNLERRRSKDEIPRWERTAKRWVTYLWPLAVLWATGSLDATIKILAALK